MIEKRNNVCLGIKLKLKLNEDSSKRFKDYFEEYSKALNFAVGKIHNEFEKRELKFAGKKQDGKWIYPNVFCSCGRQVKWYDNKIPICDDSLCLESYRNKYSENAFRKRMYSARGRKVHPSWNILNATNKLSKTHYNMLLREAFAQYKSVKEQIKERKRRLIKEKERLNYVLDMQNEEKRILLPKQGKQRVNRYIHISKQKEFSEHPELFIKRGYSLNKIQDKIKVLSRNILREEESLKRKKVINFKAKKIMNSKSAVKFISNNQVKLSISKKLDGIYDLCLPKSLKKKRLDWLNDKINIIRNQESKYSYLIRKENDFYLQYTISLDTECETQGYIGALGIDRGISFLAVCSFVFNDEKVDGHPLFIKSSEILRLKNLYKERDKILRRKHHKIKKKKRVRNIETRILLILHNVSNRILIEAEKKNAFIVLEELQKIQKSRFKISKRNKYVLSLFIFKRLSDLIDYKAKRKGRLVLYIPNFEYTSQTCPGCRSGNVQRPYNGNYKLLKCDACNAVYNADYAASVEIARRGLKLYQSVYPIS